MSESSLPFPQSGASPEAVHPDTQRWGWAERLESAVTSRTMIPIWLGTILLLGAIFRFTGLDWDQGQHLHPDERFLTMVETALEWPKENFLGTYFDEANSKLNPRNVGYGFFVYGDFPIIVIKRIAIALDKTGYDQVHLVGRAVDAIVDLATLLALFLLGRKLYKDDRVALLAALLYAMAALAIQQSHFFVVDNFTTLFVTLALYFMVRVFEHGRFWDYVLSGGFIGLALASKISIYSIVLVMAIVGAYRLYRGWQDLGRDRMVVFEQIAVRLVISGLVAFLAFRVFQPYAFEGPGFFGIGLSERWLENAKEARAWVSGDRDAPFAHQWTNRTPLIFPLKNMVLWGMGVPLGVTAWLGWGVAAWQLLRRQRWVHLIPVSWTAILFGLLGTQWVKSMRYFLPIYPTLILLGAWLLVSLWDRAKERDPALGARTRGLMAWTPAKAGVILATVVVGTLLYATAFTSIYTRPHTRVAASRWIYVNVPPGSTIANETQWDDGLPLRVDGKDGFGGMYNGLNLDITAEDSPQKMQHVLDVLDQTEYLFISSNRQYDSMTRLPMRFPMVVKYYEALFSGQLGFERVAEFTSYPQLFGIQLPDQGAEEAWSVYDHPRAQIFKKTPAYSREKAEAMLGSTNWDAIIQLWPKQATKTKNALLLTPQEQQVYQTSGTWSEMFDPANVVNRFPVVFWVLGVLLMGLIGVPYLWLVGAPLPDRGYAFAKPVGLLLVGWLVWWLASFKLVTFSVGSIALSAVLLAAGGAAIILARREAFVSWLRSNARLLVIEEGLFWAFFALVLMVRWANPDLWHPVLGGEKPMDLAFLNAVIKSAHFPPYDPWFAGGYINYYYFGFVLVATLIKLVGVVPYVAYNLVIPTLFAFLALAAFGATLALVSGNGRAAPISRRPLVFAFLGALFVAVIGNLGEARLILQGFQSLSSLDFQSTIPGLAPLVKTVHGFVTGFLAGQPLPFRIEWWYWNATRVISHPPTEAGPITELPWFTFLYADLHAHMMALPYTVVAVGLALTYVRANGWPLRSTGKRIAAPDEQAEARADGRLVSGVRLALLALVIGALWPLNTWDFPTYALVALAAFILSGWRRYGGLSAGMLGGVAGRWILLLILGYALLLPFHRNYGSAVSGIEPWRGSRTPLNDYLTIHGFFLFAITAALLTDFWLARDLNAVARLFRLGLRRWYRLGRLNRLHGRLVSPSPLYALGLYLAALGGLLTVGLAVLGKGVPAVIVALMTLTGLLFFRRPTRSLESRVPSAEPETPPDSLSSAPAEAGELKTQNSKLKTQNSLLWQMALILIFAGLGLTLAVEFVVLKNIDISRMNTVFKFYLQVWVLWGLAAAVAAALVYERLPRFQPEWRAVWRYGFIALFAATLLYPIFSTRAKINDRFDKSVGPTLDGMAFMDKAVHWDRDQQMPLVHDKEAIRWMQENVPGSPVIAEANTHPTLYGWGNRYAMFTGNPAVVGWDWHERQQRAAVPSDMISRRIQDIQQAYSTSDPNQAYRIFTRYNVRYVVVGPLERAYFPAGQDKWEPLRGLLWDLVYENPGVKIYRVISPAGAQ